MPDLASLCVVIPTVRGRENYLKWCLATIAETTVGHDTEFRVVWDRPTCAEGWNAGISTDADYVLLCADDLEATPRWLEAAIACREAGGVPAPTVQNADGSLDSLGSMGRGQHHHGKLQAGEPCHATVVPFFRSSDWEWIGEFPPLHYYSDDWFSMKAREAGLQPIVTPNMKFIHHIAQSKRKGRDRAEQDRALFESLGGTYGKADG